jgi:hypothetical protein
MKHELQNLIQGEGGNSQTSIIQKITYYLKSSKAVSSANEGQGSESSKKRISALIV